MVALVDLARTKAEKKAEHDRWDTTKDGGSDYPYGLTLFLDYGTLKKMGVSDRDFDAGQPISIVAEAMITEDRIEIVNGEKRHSISLQVHKMALDQGGKDDAAEKFYQKA